MKKFGIISGFLGAGKTTTMIALNEYYAQIGVQCRLIVNDLGNCDMVDAAYSEKNGAPVKAMPGGCICFRTQELKDVLAESFSSGSELVLSDIPGCGVGALDGVYRTFAGGETELAPFTVVVSPRELALLSDEDVSYRIHLPHDMSELLIAQIREADAVVLNKTDLISPEEIEKASALIHRIRPGITIFPVSAKYRTGISALGDYILSASASLTQPEGLGETDEVGAAQEKLCWYDCRYFVKVCCDDFSPDDYLSDLLESARFSFAAMNANTPHLKIYAYGEEGDHAKYSLTGIDYPVEKDRRFGKRCTELSVVINARLLCPPELAGQVMKACIDGAGKKHNLDTMIFSTACQ